AGGMIENVYRLQMINTSEQPLTLKLGAEGIEGLVITSANGDETIELAPASNQLIPEVVQAPALDIEPGLYDITLEGDGTLPDVREHTVAEETSFLVPLESLRILHIQVRSARHH